MKKTTISLLIFLSFNVNSQSHPSKCVPIFESSNIDLSMAQCKKDASKGSVLAQEMLLNYLYSKKDYAEVLKLATSLSDKNNPEGWLYLGMLYDNGFSVNKSKKKAIEWLSKGDAVNHAESQALLGMVIGKDPENDGDIYRAVEFTKKAANNGHITSQKTLGDFYRLGNKTKENQSMAFQWYKMAARNGNEQSFLELGKIYGKGLGIEKDLEKAFYWLEKSAHLGNNEAQFYLGNHYLNGLGVDKNPELARIWYKKSAVAGSSAAQTNLGIIYKNGTGVEKDVLESIKWYELAAEDGIIEAIIGLATIYLYEDGFIDKDKGAHFLSKASELGEPVSTVMLADMHYRGEGIEVNEKLGITLYEKAASLGNRLAQMRLGYIYYEIDKNKSYDFIQSSTLDGSSQPQAQLILLFAEGYGTEDDKSLALSMNKAGASNQDPISQYALAMQYYIGIGTEKDKDLFCYWIKKSADNGYENARALSRNPDMSCEG